MIIHFVCTGNCFRSRLAEAYLNSKNLKNIIATSSGTHAQKSSKGPICWYAEKVLKDNKIFNKTSPSYQKTTVQYLSNASFVIFMDDSNHKFCKNEFNFNRNKYEIWNIEDLETYGIYDKDLSKEKDAKRLEISKKTFEKIKNKVDELIAKIVG